MTTDVKEQKKLTPLMLTKMFLQIPKISIKPTLEEIQTAFSQVFTKTYNFIIELSVSESATLYQLRVSVIR